jgi:hypothetical protein
MSKSNFNINLNSSAKSGDLKGVKNALENGADSNNEDGWPLRIASLKGYLDIVKELLESGVDVEAQAQGNHHYDISSLGVASHYGNEEIVKVLLEYGANVNANNDSAIKLATDGGNMVIVKMLLEAGADIHVDNDYPLVTACEAGNIKLVEFLIKSGANMEVIKKVKLECVKNGMLHTFKFGNLLEVGYPNGYVEIVIPVEKKCNSCKVEKDHHVMEIENSDPPPMYESIKYNYKKKIVFVIGIIVWTFLISLGGYTIGFQQ